MLAANNGDLPRLALLHGTASKIVESLLQQACASQTINDLVFEKEASPVAESVRHASLLPTLGKDLQDLSLFVFIEQVLPQLSNIAHDEESVSLLFADSPQIDVVLQALEDRPFEGLLSDLDTALL